LLPVYGQERTATVDKKNTSCIKQLYRYSFIEHDFYHSEEGKNDHLNLALSDKVFKGEANCSVAVTNDNLTTNSRSIWEAQFVKNANLVLLVVKEDFSNVNIPVCNETDLVPRDPKTVIGGADDKTNVCKAAKNPPFRNIQPTFECPKLETFGHAIDADECNELKNKT
ncbi:hypothetical protein Ciccas_004153, partial [Cichlidogyrus casuarinus]